MHRCSVCVLIYVMHDETEEFRDKERAASILRLRSELRQTHNDIRMNSWICKHCWEIIVAVEERKVNLSLGAVEQRGIPNGPPWERKPLSAISAFNPTTGVRTKRLTSMPCLSESSQYCGRRYNLLYLLPVLQPIHTAMITQLDHTTRHRPL